LTENLKIEKKLRKLSLVGWFFFNTGTY
jgi:hypothetical protein